MIYIGEGSSARCVWWFKSLSL